jgi:hypothetical protein
MKKNLTLLAALALGAGALTASSVTGCELIASVDHSLLEGTGGMGGGGPTVGGAGGTGGQGGAGGTTTSSGGGGTGGCMGPADCDDPEPTNECIEASCDADTCGSTTLADGTAIASQAAGDCKETQCAEMGASTLVVNVDNDIFDDTKECTVDGCNGGMPTNTPMAEGTACTQGGAVCNAAGDCVECIGPAQCQAMEVCQAGMCVPDTCLNGVVDGEETDLNCGGTQCAPCGNLLDCLVDTDCQSAVCETLSCQIPSCADDMTNGTETDLNCGGSCPGCATDQTCATNADCASEVCSGMPLTCQAAVCGDGVTNAAEVCDGGDLDGATCASQGFAGNGTLSCQAGCLAFNTAGCNECDGNNDCPLPTEPICDLVEGNCEICTAADSSECGTNETCDANNDCDCGASPSSPTGQACTGMTNPDCNPGMGCYCAAAGAACGAGEVCTAAGCTCGPDVSMTGEACADAQYPSCNPGVGCQCEAAPNTCGNGFMCVAGECACDSPADCTGTGTCGAGLCTCGGTACTAGQICDMADACTCVGGSCDD